MGCIKIRSALTGTLLLLSLKALSLERFPFCYLYFLPLLAMWIGMAIAEPFKGDSSVQFRFLVAQEEYIVFAVCLVVV